MNSNSLSSTLQIDEPLNEQQNSNSNPKRSLPFELHCQIREFLPLEKGAHFLQLNHKLSQLCLAKVRQQYQQFLDNRINLMFAQFHPEIVERIKKLEDQCENSGVNLQYTYTPFEEMAEDAAKMAEWIGSRAVRAAISSGTEHFLSCWIELYHISKKSKEWLQKIYSNVDFQFHNDFRKLKLYCSPRPFPCSPSAADNSNFFRLFQQRLQKEYELRLDGWKAKIDAIGKRREEKFQSAPWFNWDRKLDENMRKLLDYWKMTHNSSNAKKLMKELLKKEEAMEAGSSKQ